MLQNALGLLAIGLLGLLGACDAATAGPPVPEGALSNHASIGSVPRVKFEGAGKYLIVEVLDDDLVHFELSAVGAGPDIDTPVETSPMVAKRDYAGPSSFSQQGNALDTPEIHVVVDNTTLCSTVTDKKKGVELTTVCPENPSQPWKALTFAQKSMQHVYGLGQKFVTPGTADGDWTGRAREPGDFGNMMDSFNAGANGNTQIPVMYAVGENNANYALFLDDVYKQRWDFTGDPWRVDTWGDQLRWYVMTGPNLPDLRRDYMELVGRPLVPPRKMFGLWVSEFGFENWGEVDDKLASLRANGFPVDGFVFDLYWFGGVTSNSDTSNMGRVAWDTTRFPDPASKLAAYRDNDGIGTILIEESYVSQNLPEHAALEQQCFLARDRNDGSCTATYITKNPWWGKGGLIDWTNDQASDYWHDTKRQPLIDMGVLGHWLDLGEPEMYNDWAHYAGGAQADVHNIFTLKWVEGIYRGYARHESSQRPFMMARSGAAGMQRYGASMWSADIASRASSLATHMNAQMHMSMSGMDYYGSDIGGFHREALDGDMNELYTEWFANSSLLDVPVRPHTDNDSCHNCYQTAPDRVGYAQANLENLRQRYELTPYLYSLAHRAYLFGDPVYPPPVYYYQNEPTLRELGHEKMIGRDMLMGIVAQYGESSRGMYLPAGKWVDYYSNDWFSSTGQWFGGFPEYRGYHLLKAPLFARAGAIIPKSYVDEQTMNQLGRRKDGTTAEDLIVRVFSDSTPTEFTLYEDDGVSTAYQNGEVRTTRISQVKSENAATLTIFGAAGSYAGAPASRTEIVEFVLDDQDATSVKLNGTPLAMFTNKTDWTNAASGWYRAGRNLVIAKSPATDVGAQTTFVAALTPTLATTSAHFECSAGNTVSGQSVYVVGNIPQLGSWSAAAAVKLDPNTYPKWTGLIANLPPGTTLEWKCIKRSETGTVADQWQPGNNSLLALPASGFAGTTTGSF